MNQAWLLIGVPIASGLMTLAYNRPAIYQRLALWLFAVASGMVMLLFAALEGARGALNKVLASYTGPDRHPVTQELARLDTIFHDMSNGYLVVVAVIGFGAWLAHAVKKDSE